MPKRLSAKDRYDNYLAGLTFDHERGSNTPLRDTVPSNQNSVAATRTYGNNTVPLDNVYYEANSKKGYELRSTGEYRNKVLGNESKFNANRRIYGLLNDARTDGDNDRKNYRDSYDFKYGLEIKNDSYNGHEDPTILGFDILLDTVTSPLFNGESGNS